MNRKMRGTAAVFIIAVAIIVAGVVNQYLAGNVGAEPETSEQEATTPTDGSDVTESETTTPTAGSETSEQETTTPTNLTRFSVVVNEAQELDVLVPVNIADGLTMEEAEQIAEVTFVQVKGEEVMHRLDSLTLDGNSIEAHYTWGLDESDMGHFFDITVDISSRLITVAHCF